MERKNPFVLQDPRPLPPSGEKPLDVCLIRGQAVESRHRVHVQVADSSGKVVHSWGNPDLRFFPRSSVKLMQAASWLAAELERSGELSKKELAIACGSHEGEEFHVHLVKNWLARLGLSEANLECGPHEPYHRGCAHALIRAGQPATQLHNNCSGKHSGLLQHCVLKGWESRGYTNFDHPVQENIRHTMNQFFDLDFAKQPWGIDGCGIPTYAITLASLATGMARAADAKKLNGNLREAVKRLNAAIVAEPSFIGGTASFCTDVITHTEGRVLAKTGAEGVYTAWIPEAGIGLAMKAEDGNVRATKSATVAVLRELGFPLDFYSPLVKRWTGEVIGQFLV